MSTPTSPQNYQHLCLDLSPAAIRDHVALVGEVGIVDALSDEDLTAAAEAWLDEGGAEPWASYDRFCRAICVRAREAAASRTPVAHSADEPASSVRDGQDQWTAVGEPGCSAVASRHGATWEIFYAGCKQVEELPGLGNEYEAGAIIAGVVRRHVAVEHAQQERAS